MRNRQWRRQNIFVMSALKTDDGQDGRKEKIGGGFDAGNLSDCIIYILFTRYFYMPMDSYQHIV